MKQARPQLSFKFRREKAGGYSASAARPSMSIRGKTFQALLKNVAATVDRRFNGKRGWRLNYDLRSRGILTSAAAADVLVSHLEHVLGARG